VSDPTQHAILSARIAAALADVDDVNPNDTTTRVHGDRCWRNRDHGDCLAARIRRTLTEGDR
jgi:hypothetical protein